MAELSREEVVGIVGPIGDAAIAEITVPASPRKSLVRQIRRHTIPASRSTPAGLLRWWKSLRDCDVVGFWENPAQSWNSHD